MIEARHAYASALQQNLSPADYQASILLGSIGLQQELPREEPQIVEPRERLERRIELCETLIERSPRSCSTPPRFLRVPSSCSAVSKNRRVSAAASDAQYRSARTSAMRIAASVRRKVWRRASGRSSSSSIQHASNAQVHRRDRVARRLFGGFVPDYKTLLPQRES